MTTWEDVTSRRRDDRTQETRTVRYVTRAGTVTVTRHLDHGPDVWCLIAHDAGIPRRELKSKDLEAAKKEALTLVWNRLKQFSDDVFTGLEVA